MGLSSCSHYNKILKSTNPDAKLDYAMDQTSKVKAINETQLYIDQHPRSTRIEECNKLIDQLRLKMEMKDFENAKLYYHMDEYKAAVTAFKNLLRDYPSTKFREEA